MSPRGSLKRASLSMDGCWYYFFVNKLDASGSYAMSFGRYSPRNTAFVGVENCSEAGQIVVLFASAAVFWLYSSRITVVVAFTQNPCSPFHSYGVLRTHFTTVPRVGIYGSFTSITFLPFLYHLPDRVLYGSIIIADWAVRDIDRCGGYTVYATVKFPRNLECT